MKSGNVLMLFAFVCALAASAVDVNIEGRWVSGGVPRPLVSTTCDVRLYDAASGGTLLAEVPGVGLSTDSNGYFVVSTAVTPQQAVPDTFWVGVKPATGDEISPRFRVAPVPFALVADEVAIVKSDKALELTGEAMIERLDVSGGLKTKDWTVPANSVVTAKNIQVGNVRLDKLDICKAGMLGFFNDDGATPSYDYENFSKAEKTLLAQSTVVRYSNGSYMLSSGISRGNWTFDSDGFLLIALMSDPKHSIAGQVTLKVGQTTILDNKSIGADYAPAVKRFMTVPYRAGEEVSMTLRSWSASNLSPASSDNDTQFEAWCGAKVRLLRFGRK